MPARLRALPDAFPDLFYLIIVLFLACFLIYGVVLMIAIETLTTIRYEPAH